MRTADDVEMAGRRGRSRSLPSPPRQRRRRRDGLLTDPSSAIQQTFTSVDEYPTGECAEKPK